MPDTDLEHQLLLKQQELDMIFAIDEVRDAVLTPQAMLSGIVHVMAQLLRADVCALYLLDRHTDVLDLKVVDEYRRSWLRLNGALSPDDARRLMVQENVVVWQLDDREESAMYLAAVPIVLHHNSLGLLVLARAQVSFSADDVHLLEVAESQIDSAVIQAYTRHELSQRNKELETVYRFDRIRDQNLAFDEMLSVVLQELCSVIDAEMGFVMLYNQEGERLEMRAITDDGVLQQTLYYETINKVAYTAIQDGRLVCFSGAGAEYCNVMCVPLILHEEIIGVFGAVNRHVLHGFTPDDQRLLKAIVSQMDTAILESLERRQLRRVLGRSLDHHVLEKLLANPNVDLLKGERSMLSVLYADLRGSTFLAAHLEPELLVEFFNDYLGKMTEVVISLEGTLDKFVGDEVMAIFGANLHQPDHALRAVRVGLAMQEKHQVIMEKWKARDIETSGLGVGIATGELIVGEIGCERHSDYTVIGPAANLGSRICGVAKSGEVLICQATYDLIKSQVEVISIPGMQFKGIDHPVTVYHVVRILDDKP